MHRGRDEVWETPLSRFGEDAAAMRQHYDGHNAFGQKGLIAWQREVIDECMSYGVRNASSRRATGNEAQVQKELYKLGQLTDGTTVPARDEDAPAVYAIDNDSIQDANYVVSADLQNTWTGTEAQYGPDIALAKRGMFFTSVETNPGANPSSSTHMLKAFKTKVYDCLGKTLVFLMTFQWMAEHGPREKDTEGRTIYRPGILIAPTSVVTCWFTSVC